MILAMLIGIFAQAPGSEADQNAATLDRLVHKYFTAQDPAERGRHAREIEQTVASSIPAVLGSIGRVDLWTRFDAQPIRFSVTLPQSRRVTIECAYPEHYDPSIAYPTILCMPDDGSSAADTLTIARRVLGDAIRGFVVVAPARTVGGFFHLPGTSAGDFTALIYQLRRRIHIDSDRLFLFGFGTGGDAAWLSAMFHPDVPAGVIALASYPHVPYGRQTLPFLLPNLRHVPVLCIWEQLREKEISVRRLAEVAHNSAALGIAVHADLPVSGLEVPDRWFQQSAMPVEPARTILAGVRAPVATDVALWFRYPEQGRVAWLRCKRFARDMWVDSELTIRPTRKVDRDAFITRSVQGKLAFLGGRIEGQSIEITARRCRRVELALPVGLIDFTKPISVTCNGKIRYEGHIEPSIDTLLESAYEAWDLRRPAVARLSFSIKQQRGSAR